MQCRWPAAPASARCRAPDACALVETLTQNLPGLTSLSFKKDLFGDNGAAEISEARFPGPLIPRRRLVKLQTKNNCVFALVQGKPHALTRLFKPPPLPPPPLFSFPPHDGEGMTYMLSLCKLRAPHHTVIPSLRTGLSVLQIITIHLKYLLP